MFCAIIVLPGPCGATSTTLRVSAQKLEAERVLDRLAVETLQLRPIEVRHGFEAAKPAAVAAARVHACADRGRGQPQRH